MALAAKSGGLLACKPSNFVGMFDYLKINYSIKAAEIVKILDDFPELSLQNRRDLLRLKFELIAKHCP